MLWCDHTNVVVQKAGDRKLAERHGGWVGWCVATFHGVVGLAVACAAETCAARSALPRLAA